MNGGLLALVLAVIGGVLLAVQAPTNALLGKASGSPIVAAFISFLIGTIALGAAVLGTSGRPFDPSLRQVPWYAWLGGFYGAFFVAVAAFGAPRVGVGVLSPVSSLPRLCSTILACLVSPAIRSRSHAPPAWCWFSSAPRSSARASRSSAAIAPHYVAKPALDH
jgi:uncharacterized membrane protein YdcZ (DUF606 family)